MTTLTISTRCVRRAELRLLGPLRPERRMLRAGWVGTHLVVDINHPVLGMCRAELPPFRASHTIHGEFGTPLMAAFSRHSCRPWKLCRRLYSSTLDAMAAGVCG